MTTNPFNVVNLASVISPEETAKRAARLAANRTGLRAEKHFPPLMGTLLKEELTDRARDFAWLYGETYVRRLTDEINEVLGKLGVEAP